VSEAPVSDYGVSVASNGAVSLPAGDTVRNFHGQAVLYNGSNAVGVIAAPGGQSAVASGPPTVTPAPGPTSNSLLKKVKTKGLVNASCGCEVTWGIITGTIYFDKLATAIISVGGGFVLGGSITAACLLTIIGAPLCVVFMAYSGMLIADAGTAWAENRCLMIGYTFIPPYWNGAGDYSGGYCTGSY
jgi:hypothetical protein